MSPASYLGLLVNAKSEFNGPVKMTDSLTVIPRSTAPPNPQDGTLWMKDTGVLAVCFGGSWKNINTTP